MQQVGTFVLISLFDEAPLTLYPLGTVEASQAVEAVPSVGRFVVVVISVAGLVIGLTWICMVA